MLVLEARKYLGYAEPSGDDYFIKLYNQYTGAGFGMNVPWCAIFVSVVARLAGISGDIVPNFADCDAGKIWYKNKGRWENSYSQGGSYVPRRNDVVFYSSGHTMGDSTHVGYVQFVSGDTMTAVEGNKSDAVGERVISLSDPYIIGFGRVGEYLVETSVQVPGEPAYSDERVYYRAHVQNYGTLDAVRDGQTAGTTGRNTPMEGFWVDMRVIRKKYGNNVKIFAKAHIRDIGWRDIGYIEHDTLIGTQGQVKALEAFQLTAEGLPGGVNIYYKSHVQDLGWGDWVAGGNMTGTVGQVKSIEAIQIVIR